MAKDELKQERMKILDLLNKGTITSEDAEKLLSAIGDKNEQEHPEVIIPTKKASFRMLKVYVDSADGDVVKIELPVEFAKLLKTGKFKLDSLDDMDIDLDALIQMVNAGALGEIVNIKSADGDLVRIVIE
ncbi:MAG TPA: hypothetical protein DCR44_03370 [Acholeplasmatales bacterium]|nr:MAG: hypothetical protein A2Y16_01005 [Tenericutes bacterium GWF2_57_13]HAQ56429.1 hypothetical protein [Acholeplasmatales bacterium]